MNLPTVRSSCAGLVARVALQLLEVFCAAIGRVLASFRCVAIGRSYVTDISLVGIPERAPSMLLGTIVGPNTYMEVSRACDEAMAPPSSVPRALLGPFLRGVTFLASEGGTEGLDEILANKANQQCDFKT